MTDAPDRRALHLLVGPAGTAAGRLDVRTRPADGVSVLDPEQGDGPGLLETLRRTSDKGKVAKPQAGVIRAFAERVARHGGTVVVPESGLAALGPAKIGPFVAAMSDKADVDVHVVLLAQDPARQLLAEWSHHVLHRGTDTWTEHLASVAADEARFGRRQDPAQIARRWTGPVAPRRVHVVTVPRPGDGRSLSAELADVVGWEPDALRAAWPGVDAVVSWAGVEVVRRVNEALAGRLEGAAGYTAAVRRRLATDLLDESGVPGAADPGVPEDLGDWVGARAGATIADLRESACDLRGTLDDLRPALDAPSAEAAEQHVAALAVAAVARIGQEHPIALRELREQGTTDADADDAADDGSGEASEPPPLRRRFRSAD